ncbi:MAG: hypothetical protein GY936_14650 [Ignavibacteriae bacterium]|nr:hypothetical protein [Ignavibacteriota bacterium]
MNKLQHKLYVGFFFVTTFAVLFLLIYNGYDYYSTPAEEKFFSPEHLDLKPSGLWGHGFGIIGTLSMTLGVSVYMVRKRVKSLMRFGALKHWLEFHIFLCTIGPILVLFHTAFKFGGIVSISFWSMVAVFLSGVIGRFIYIRIPRTIEGEELNIEQIRTINKNLSLKLKAEYNVDEEIINSIETLSSNGNSTTKSLVEFITEFIPEYFRNRKNIKTIDSKLKNSKVSKNKRIEIKKIIKDKISITNRISYLRTMQNLFKYWHVAHLPFAIIMLVIMLVHVVVTITFGYRWIF